MDGLNCFKGARETLRRPMAYRRGRRFEWEVRRLLEERGFLVIRAARSRPIDLVALRGGEAYLIECKYSSRMRRGAGERLVELAERAGARPILASRRRYQRGISFIDLKTGEAFQP